MTEPFSLSLEGIETPLLVLGFRGREAMNSPYRFELDVLSEAAPDQDAILGLSGRLVISTSAEPRVIHGIITACEFRPRREDGQSVLRLRLEPRLARLKHASCWRIFHDSGIVKIVSAVLGEHRVPFSWRTARLPLPRPHRVQRGERDLAFVDRILADDGIFYWFEQTVGGERVVLADRAAAYDALHGSAVLHHKGSAELNAADDRVLFDMSRNSRMRPRGMRVRLFDWTRPRRDAVEESGLKRGTSGPELALEEHEHASEGLSTEPAPAPHRLDEARLAASLAQAVTLFPHVTPGAWFTVNEHSEPALNTQYVISAVEHVGRAPRSGQTSRTYEAKLTLHPRDACVRPHRSRELLARGLETATVMGPQAQEIYTDEQGRIQVRFHWDTRTQGHPPATAWVRVSQAWGGGGYGATFTPRAGNEVLIGYIDGDPDKPIVVGSLHNGLNSSAVRFPHQQTRSGIATRSSPESGSGHLLMFEDRKGEELIVLHSCGSLTIEAVGNGMFSTGGLLDLVTGEDRRERVGGDLTTSVAQSVRLSVGQDREATIAGADITKITKDASLTIGGDATSRVTGGVLATIGAGRHTVVGSGPDAADESLSVSGVYRVGAARGISFTSSKAMEFICGDSRISILPDRIMLESTTIQLQASKAINLVQGPEATSSSLVLNGAASLAGGSASVISGLGGKLILDAEAKLNGALVKLNCDDGTGSSERRIVDPTKTGVVSFTVLPDHLPPGTREVTLVISTPAGEVVERACAVGGTISFEGHPGERFTLLDMKIGDVSLTVHDRTSKDEDPNGKPA